MKFKVVSSHYGELAQKDVVINNLTEYCNLHGYELVLNYKDEGMPLGDVYWKKMEVIKENMNDCDYLLWVDTDTFIYNLHKTLGTLLDPNFDFDLLLTCENCIQTGAYFFKNSEWSHELIDRMIAFGKSKNTNGVYYCDDTLALIYMLDEEKYMGHGLDKIVSSHQDDLDFIALINRERETYQPHTLLRHIKLVPRDEFMIKHVHVYQSPVPPFIIHTPGCEKTEKYRFIKYYSDNKNIDYHEFNIK